MNSALEVAIVGAGPYGLSIAAHLRARSINCGIFGPAMDVWQRHMPKGMLLKSDGFASNLSEPDGSFTLEVFLQDARTAVRRYPDASPVGDVCRVRSRISAEICPPTGSKARGED